MSRQVTRRAVLGAVGAAALAGCRGGGEADTGGGTAPPTSDDRLPLSMAPDVLRAEAVSGGPPKDGIPSIDDPSFLVPIAFVLLVGGLLLVGRQVDPDLL